MFALQKILARVFFPLPIAFWLLLAAGIVAWWGRRTWNGGLPHRGRQWSNTRRPRFGRRDRLARGLVVAAAVWLFLISWDPVADPLLRTLENRYPPLLEVPAEVTHIVVLGGGAHAEEGRPAAARLSQSSQGRVLEGVRLWRAAAASRASGIPTLIFTGDFPDRSGRRRSMASLAAETAEDLGVPPQFIVTLEETLNTAMEAAAVARYLDTVVDFDRSSDTAETADKSGGVLLVTSASHMPRSMELFRRAGLDPVSGPAQYLTDTSGRHAWKLMPNAEALQKTETVFYEVLGMAWARIRY